MLKKFRQQKDYTCGPASIRAVLHLYDKHDITEMILEAILHTTSEYGTLPEDLVKLLPSLGFVAEIHNTTEYNCGDIVLVQENGYGHWIVMLDADRYWDAWDGNIKKRTNFDTHATVKNTVYDNLVIRISVDNTK